MGGFAWVTLATNDSYSLGALVLAHSLRRAGTPHDLVALITPGVTDVMREKLSTVFTVVQEVNILDSKDEANLRLLSRPELGITFTKLHCWRLTQYEKCVFVDADALVIRNCDELFQREELSAAPDVGWPDCFNSGVFVFKPSQETYDSLVAFATAKGSFDGGDQGLLNMYFSDWAQKDISKHLPFIYNMCSTATYSYLPAFKQFGEDVRIIHFIGATKPWLQYFDTLTGIVQPPSGSSHLQPLLQVWWNIFCDNVHPQLNPIMATSTLAPSGHNTFSFSQISRICRTYDPNNETYSDFGLQEVDFSEFKDPWEFYSPQLDPFLRDIQQITQENLDNSELESYFQKSEEPDSFQQPNQTQEFKDNFEEEPPCWSDRDNEISEYHPEQKESKDFSQNEIHQVEFQNKEENQKDYLIHEHKDQQSSPEECQIHQVIHPLQEEIHTSQHFQSEFKEEQHSHSYHHSHFHSHSHSSVAYSHDQKHHTKLDQTSDKNLKSFSQSRKVPPKGILKNTVGTDKAPLQKKLYREQDMKQSRPNDKQTKPLRLRSQFPIKTRILPNKVASQSEQRMKHPENNAGLAGALAKLTLGEPRSHEQFAFEEHMRKQSWEQGQIDYLGRDSFDNIWKKISETLSTGTVREKTPPQADEKELKKKVTEAPVIEEAEKTKTENAETLKTGTKKSEEVAPGLGTDAPTAVPVQEVKQIPTALEVQKVPESVSETSVIPEEIKPTPVVSEPVTEIPAVPKEVESGPVVAEPILETPVAEAVKPAPVTEAVQPAQVTEAAQPVLVVPKPVSEIPVVSEEIKAPIVSEVQQTPVPEQNQPTFVSESTTTPEQTQETPAIEPDPTKPIIEQLQEAEEAQEKPVPIQVAESVLQAEPKESVSQVTLPVEEEAISSIVTSVQESALTVSEALIDPAISTPTNTEPTTPKLENGSVDPETEILPSPTISSAPETPESSTALLARSSNVVSLIPDPTQVSKTEVQPTEEIKDTDLPKEAEVPKETEVLKETEVTKETEVLKEIEIPKAAEVQEPKLERRTSSSMEKPLIPASEPKLTVQIPHRQPSEISGSVEKSEQQKESEASSEGSPEKTSEFLESPSRPTRSKELKAPATPTVTEATPPTSPPIDPEDGETDPKVAKKVVKKIVKKQSTEESEEAEGESSGKKVTKKVVKKVVKKKEGDAEGSSSTEKKKVVKKTTTTKSAQLETDKSVPETPPPGSSEVPVPPKRKVKTSTTTKEMTTKKPDTEL